MGPNIAFPELFSVNLNGDIQKTLVDLLDRARAPRDVFRSLHVGVSTIVLYAVRHGRLTSALLAPMIIGNWISTMYLRAHYFIDLVAGWAVAIACIVIAHQLLVVETGWRTDTPSMPDAVDAEAPS